MNAARAFIGAFILLVVIAAVIFVGLLLLPFLLVLGLAGALYLPWRLRRLNRMFREAAQAAAPEAEPPAADADCIDVEFKTVEKETRKLE